MALPKTETFTDTDRTPLSTHDANWVLVTGGHQIYNNSLITAGGTGTTENCHRWAGDAFNATHYAKATYVDASGRLFGVAVNIQSGSASYYAWYGMVKSYGNRREMVEVSSGTVGTTHYSAATSIALNDVLYLEEGASSLKTWKLNGTTISSVTDSTFSGGSAGIASRGSGDFSRIDNVEVGNLGGAAFVPAPYFFNMLGSR